NRRPIRPGAGVGRVRSRGRGPQESEAQQERRRPVAGGRCSGLGLRCSDRRPKTEDRPPPPDRSLLVETVHLIPLRELIRSLPQEKPAVPFPSVPSQRRRVAPACPALHTAAPAAGPLIAEGTACCFPGWAQGEDPLQPGPFIA